MHTYRSSGWSGYVLAQQDGFFKSVFGARTWGVGWAPRSGAFMQIPRTGLNQLGSTMVEASSGGLTLWSVGDRGSIFKYDDPSSFSRDRSKWRKQGSGTRETLRDVDASSYLVAWAVGNGGRVLRTKNGGLHWEELNKTKRIWAGREVMDLSSVSTPPMEFSNKISVDGGQFLMEYAQDPGGGEGVVWIVGDEGKS